MESVQSARSKESGTNVVRDAVREAFAARRRLRIQGAGTWLEAGRIVEAEHTLAIGNDRGIVEYVPGDLTLTARAGTRLAEIATATTEHGQWLPLDPWGGDDGTIGATVSTATSGPHAHAMGLPRDTVLGLEFVTGTGEIVRSGGRVVKNVAGFDLTRLLVGSWGTLGVITEVTVRLRARPERTLTLAIPVSRETVAKLALDLRALPFTPLASELLSPVLSTMLGFTSAPHLLIQLGGNHRSVQTQVDLFRTFGSLREGDDSIWARLRSSVVGVASWRWSQLPSVFAETWSAAEDVAQRAPDAMFHGSPERGVVRFVVARDSAMDPKTIADVTRFGGTVAIEALPHEAWKALDQRAQADPVSRAIRGKFDPAGILNAGILGKGG